ncbi:MAG TPA: B12-binding domain-containing radical SAM protein [Chitinivibrionales bacterium]|nr:B12-binding domain-containing radical SAM protein [Chitinivibrionales bacterium]
MDRVKTVLLVYIGSEQGSWGNIAFPKPWHYYIMPGVRYCAAALESDSEIAGSCAVECRYFNRTVQDIGAITAQLLDKKYDLIGFSSYCWNITDVCLLAGRVKQRHSDTIIMMGGPEVFMRDQGEADAFFHGNSFADCLVFGEAEKKISLLVKALFGRRELFPQARGFALAPRLGGASDFTMTYAAAPSEVPAIIPFAIEVPRTRDCGLAMVYETGRGCPYRCIYCQFGHRNTKPFRLDITRVRAELCWLLEKEIDCIHFADAVFDLDPDYTKEVLRLLVEKNRRTSLFFYCSFNKLDEELAQLFKASQCQIGVGIQSTNTEVLKIIKRTLSPQLFERNAELLERHRLNFYTDLIFGLPNDDPASYERSFDQALGLDPSFVMTFPLTLIKGTPLADNAASYGIRRFASDKIAELGLMCGIQYDNMGLFRAFSLQDLAAFDDVALALFYFYNRFPHCLSYLRRRCVKGRAFGLYRSIGSETKEFLRRIGRTASNTDLIEGFQDEIQTIFLQILEKESAGERETSGFKELFKLDIYRILIINSSQREKIFRASFPLKSRCIDLAAGIGDAPVKAIRSTHGKVFTLSYRLKDLLRLHEKREALEAAPEAVYIHAPFGHWNASVASVNELKRFLVEFIPADRGLRLQSIIKAALRHFSSHASAKQVDDNAIRLTLTNMACEEVVLVYKED